MFCFLCKSFPFRQHIIDSISRSPTLGHLLCVQTQWFSVRYCNSHSNASNGDLRSFTVSYLIDNCGFSSGEAVAASKHVGFETRERPDSVIKFLENQGLSQSRIRFIVGTVPMILRFDPEKNFLPKIEFFRSRGASSSDISKIISSCPNILRRSLCNQLIPSFNFFRDLLQNDGIVIKALKQYSGILLEIDNFVMPNMVSLREVGVPESSITKLLRFYPKAITISSVRFKEILVEVKQMKFNPLSFVFLSAVRTLALMSKSTWREKVDTFKKWGWSDNDILVAFRSRPLFIVTSDDKIDAVMDLLVNKLNCEPSTISRYSILLTMSLNKRLVPRAAVLQVLLSNGKVKKERKLTVFFYTESVFLEKFVMCHEKEASELLKLYQAQLKLAW